MRLQGRGFVNNEDTFSSPSSHLLVGTAANDTKVIFGEFHKTCHHPYYFQLEKGRPTPEVVMKAWRKYSDLYIRCRIPHRGSESALPFISLHQWRYTLKTGRTFPGKVAYLPFLFFLAFLGQSVTSVTVAAGKDPARAPPDTCWDFLRNEETDGNKKHSCFWGASERNLA